MSPVFVNTVRASFYRFRPDLGGLRVRREILVWRTVLPQCVGIRRIPYGIPLRQQIWGTRSPLLATHLRRTARPTSDLAPIGTLNP